MHKRKTEAQKLQKGYIWHCLATSGTDKQQHFAGKRDGKFLSVTNKTLNNQFDKKLVLNRVGVSGRAGSERVGEALSPELRRV